MDEGYSFEMANAAAEGLAVASGGAPSAEAPATAGGAPGGHGEGGPPRGGGASAKGALDAPDGPASSAPEFLGSEAERTPPYPEAAKARGVEGRVLLRVHVATTGRVDEVMVLEPLEPSCDAVAKRWAKERWRFRPGRAKGQPVAVWIEVPVTFVLDR